MRGHALATVRISARLPGLLLRGIGASSPILANVFRAKPIGRTAKVPAEVRDAVKISADGGRSEVATLQLLKRELTWLVHRESSFSVSQTTRQAKKLAQPNAEVFAAAAASFKSTRI